jgi:hypothetical protein
MVVTSRSRRLRFSPTVIYALAGKLMTVGGGYLTAPGCTTIASDCLHRPSKFQHGRTTIAYPRPGTLTFGRMRHLHLRLCGTAEQLGSRTADLDLAPAHIAASRFFGKPRDESS